MIFLGEQVAWDGRGNDPAPPGHRGLPAGPVPPLLRTGQECLIF